MKHIHLNLRSRARAVKIFNAHQLVKATGLSVSTGYALWSEKAQGIEFSTLGKLCEVLNCQPSELLVQQNGEKRGPKSNGTKRKAAKKR